MRTDGPDTASPFGAIEALLSAVEAADARGALAVDDAMQRVAGMLRESRDSAAAVFFIGNGASQAISSHMAADLTKNGRLKAIAFTDPSLLTCVGNDLGYEQVFAEPLRRWAAAGDALVAISSSGASPNILEAVRVAREKGLAVVTLSGFAADNPLRGKGDLSFYVPSRDYGDVEVVHHAICHCIVDRVVGGAGS